MPSEQVPSKDQLYYLQVRGYCGNSVLWWRKGRCGYTSDIQAAHVFTKDEAFGQQRCRPDEDFPWRKDYIDSILQSHVHCEHLDRDHEAAFVATLEPPAVPSRVRLLKDIYDDGQDHHPPGYIARKGEVVEVRELRALAVAHEGITDQSFVIRTGEFEPAPSQPPASEPSTARPRAICGGCQSLINPKACKCTHSLDSHPWPSDHALVPMGCSCQPPSVNEDSARLDYLDELNRKANERANSSYGWRLDINHNRVALADCHLPGLTAREAIDAHRAGIDPYHFRDRSTLTKEVR
jgi:hypothetical protein